MRRSEVSPLARRRLGGAHTAIAAAMSHQARAKRTKEVMYTLECAKPPACAACRISHLPCDHERPCKRCRRLNARCEGTLPLRAVLTIWARCCVRFLFPSEAESSGECAHASSHAETHL